MARPPTARTRELESLLRKVQRSVACLAGYEMWSDRGRTASLPDVVAEMESDYAKSSAERADAGAALEALVATTRADTPAELEAWIAAHEEYLRLYLAGVVAAGGDTWFPDQGLLAWGAVRDGSRAYVDDSDGVPYNTPAFEERYRHLFGIDQQSLARIGETTPAWRLAFRPIAPKTATIADGEAALAAATKGPVTTVIGELGGNPRDFYSRRVIITADPALQLELHQAMMGEDDPSPIADLVTVSLGDLPGATFASKLALVTAVSEAFAALGYRDLTLASSPAAIVDAAMWAGDLAAAARLRTQITAALVAEVATHAMISLSFTRPDDIEAVLAAYPAPLGNGYVTLWSCGLTRLPSGLGRFAGEIDALLFEGDQGFDGDALRGVPLPNVKLLSLATTGIRKLVRADLAGFPNIVELSLENSGVMMLDPGIIEVCPKLARVRLGNTPLATSTDALAELRARWPGVTRWDGA